MRSFTTKNIFTLVLLTAMLVVGGNNMVKGQDCVPKVRKYATRQHDFSTLLASAGSAMVAARAVDGNVKTSSSLGLLGLVGLVYAEQVLDFNPDPTSTSTYSPMISAGTPITIKLALPTALLNLLGGIEIQPIKNMKRSGIWSYETAGPTSSGTDLNLLGVLNGSGDVEVTITPDQEYQGVRIRLTSAVGLGVNAGVYEAYIEENSSLATNDCSTGVDVLQGVRAGTVVGGIANATGGVVSPYNAIDLDISSPTYAQINVGVQLLSKAYLTAILSTPAQKGDNARIVIQDPGSVLLNLTLLNGFSIQPYMGSVPAGSAFTQTSSLLTLKLLPGPGNISELVFPVSQAFDRVEISMGGVANALGSLRIYDIKRIIKPITQIGGSTITKKEICLNTTTALSIKDPQDCTSYVWYKKGTPDVRVTPSASTTSYTPDASSLSLGDNIFYVIASRANCTETSENIMDTITVKPLPTATIAGTATICKGAPAPTITFTGASGTAPYTFTYNINGASSQTITTTTGNFVTLPAPTAAEGTFTYTLTSVKDNSASQCSQSITGQTAVITVSPVPTITLGMLPGACQEAQNTTIPYTSTTGTPTTYNITWDANALAKGFVNVSGETFPATSPITITKPTSLNVTPGIYSGTMTVSNANCTSQSYPISFTIVPKPPQPAIHLITNSQY